eukprot:TRINITY_DN11742_c0_g1_i1.p1 TRINITY_DN11742_c0_g1~~TRINITY_DN11742_c0_g1_i1.p1  ORF type:complete len:271 (-),score=45.07 TRINITY_DN11742_c0_g1_i1:162-974(-)
MNKRSRVQGGWGGRGNSESSITAKKTSGPTFSYQQKQAKDFQILQDGLVYFPNALSMEEQKWIIDVSFAIGKTSEQSRGFYTTTPSGMMALNQVTRGRVIKHGSEFPDRFKPLVEKFVKKARMVDKTMPDMEPNTVLMNYYQEGATFKWHKDSEDPLLIKTKEGRPIVSFSVGMSCTFGYKNHYDDVEYKTVQLNSGDVLLFGGESRMIVHSVVNVIPRSMPGPLMSKMRTGRLNLTVRDIGRGRIDDSQFPAYRVLYDGEEENRENEEL